MRQSIPKKIFILIISSNLTIIAIALTLFYIIHRYCSDEIGGKLKDQRFVGQTYVVITILFSTARYDTIADAAAFITLMREKEQLKEKLKHKGENLEPTY